MRNFDHNATSPLLPEARRAWLDATERYLGNPSSPHRLGAQADAALNEARHQLASRLGSDPHDVVWTAGATESTNTVLHHFARTLTFGEEVWVSAIEHPCVLDTAQYYFKKRLRLIPVTNAGVIDLSRFALELREARPGLVAVMAANNETGVVQPWRQIAAVCRDREVPFLCDAAQWLGRLPARGLGECDFVAGCAHKFGGPTGVGFLKCPPQVRLEPLLMGGPHEANRRAGTENVAGVLAMMAASGLRETELLPQALQSRLAWRKDFETKLLEVLPESEIVGVDQERLWNTVSALMPGAECQGRWVANLDKLGFAVSTGSACCSGRAEPSHVLSAMGYSPASTRRVLRFSSGWDTQPGEWDSLLNALLEVHRGIGS